MKNISENKKNIIRGVIDIGTNSCRLFLAEVEKNENEAIIKKKLYKETQITKLGKFINPDSTIQEEGMNIVTNVIKKYAEKAKEYNADEIIGFATSATREAANKDIFLKNVSVSLTAPALKLLMNLISFLSPKIISVLPPPISKSTTGFLNSVTAPEKVR